MFPNFRQSLSSIGTGNMSKETMLRQRLFLTVQKALLGDFLNRAILVNIFFPILILRILPQQNTALLSHVRPCVRVSVTGVTSHLFAVITCIRPCKPYIFWKLMTATIHWPLGDPLVTTWWPPESPGSIDSNMINAESAQFTLSSCHFPLL